MIVVGAAIAAAFAVSGCAPAGYGGGADYGSSAEPAGNAQAAPDATADPSSTADPVAQADPSSTADPAAENAGALPASKTTEKLVAAKVKRMGSVVEDENGFVLYRFDKDSENPSKSNCNGDCAKTWPPALTNNGKPELKGVDSKLVGTVTRADGTKQLTLKGWPLYRYVGDVKAGSWKGQNVNGTWFVIEPTGAKNLTCLPPKSKPVAPPSDESGSGSGSGDISY